MSRTGFDRGPGGTGEGNADSANNAAIAVEARDEARRWAENPVGVEPDPTDYPGRYSSYAYSVASEDWYKLFRGQYYGPYASDPVTDPNGDPPTVGDIYYNTTYNYTKIWDGSAWVANTGGGIPEDEADAKYVNVDGDTMTGGLTMGANANINLIGAQGEVGILRMVPDIGTPGSDVLEVVSNDGLILRAPYVVLDTANPILTMPGAQVGSYLVVAGLDPFGGALLGYEAAGQPGYSDQALGESNVIIKAAGVAPPSPWVDLGMTITLTDTLDAGTITVMFDMLLSNPTTRAGKVEFGLRVNGADLAREITVDIPANFLSTVALSIPLVNGYNDGDVITLIARVTSNTNDQFSLEMIASSADPAVFRLYTPGSGGLTQEDADLRYLQLAGGTMAGNITFPDAFGLYYRGEDTLVKWRLQLSGVASDDSIGFYNEALGTFPFLLTEAGDITLDGGLTFKYGANNFSKYNLAGDATSFIVGILDNAGTEGFSIYHNGKFALWINPANEAVTFDNAIFAYTINATNGGSKIVDWYRQSDATDVWWVHPQVRTSDGAYIIWDDAFSMPMMTLTQGGSLALTLGLNVGAAIASSVDGSGSADAFVWSYQGNSRFNIKSLGGWAGFEWHMPGVSYLGCYQVSDGSLRWIGGQDISVPIASIHPSGDIRAKRFVASPSPG